MRRGRAFSSPALSSGTTSTRSISSVAGIWPARSKRKQRRKWSSRSTPSPFISIPNWAIGRPSSFPVSASPIGPCSPNATRLNTTPTPGAVRAAELVSPPYYTDVQKQRVAELIDRETGASEMLEALRDLAASFDTLLRIEKINPATNMTLGAALSALARQTNLP